MEAVTEKVANLALEEVEEESPRQNTSSLRKTGVIYDPHMLTHCNEVDSNHPESPQRISEIWAGLAESGLRQRCVEVQSRKATREEILKIHDETHYTTIESLPEKSAKDLKSLSDKYISIYLNKDTFSCAMLAAGSVVEITEQVVKGELNNGVAIVRPPGHHAEAEQCMGFCIFNSVAIATKVAMDKYNMKRILIVDWDVHHGNATQHQFYKDNRVLYISLHRYDNGLFFPGGEGGSASHVGCEEAEGYNVNIAWNKSSMGDAEYIAAFTNIILPIAYEFNPELVLVSSGFDAARGDPLGHYNVTPEGYAHMTHLLSGLAGGKIVIVLEGGYNLTSISQSMSACTAVLLGDPLPQLTLTEPPNKNAIQCIHDVVSAHRPFWKSLSVLGSADVSPSKSDDVTTDKSDPPKQSNDQEGGEATGEVGGATGEVGGATGGADYRETQDSNVDQMGAFGQVMFSVTPLSSCEHLSSISSSPLPADVANATCEECGETKEPWVCLSCHHVYCGRYINQHMLAHTTSSTHPLALSLADISVWCFPCDAYLHNDILTPAKTAVHRSKFGVDPGQE